MNRLPPRPTLFPYTTLFRSYDLSGDGRRVVRGGYGLYFDQANTGGYGDVVSQNKRPMNVLATRTNTAIGVGELADRKSTRLNSSHSQISYAVFCLKKKNKRE